MLKKLEKRFNLNYEEPGCRCWATVYFSDSKEEIENINQNS